ncbi:hypothetical protein DNF23_32580 [Pseudomonas syringae pv. pisi]
MFLFCQAQTFIQIRGKSLNPQARPVLAEDIEAAVIVPKKEQKKRITNMSSKPYIAVSTSLVPATDIAHAGASHLDGEEYPGFD